LIKIQFGSLQCRIGQGLAAMAAFTAALANAMAASRLISIFHLLKQY
jgi:hypothetical protein